MQPDTSDTGRWMTNKEPRKGDLSVAKGLITEKDKLVWPSYLSLWQIDSTYNKSGTMSFAELRKSLALNDSNELIINDKDILDSTRGVVKELAATAFKMIVKGENPLNVSLPARVLENCSQLEKNCELFNSVHLLHKAVKVSEPIEKLKYVMTMFACNFYCGIGPKKPFNPYLGETLQGYFKDGTKVYFEHLSHKPMIDAFLLINEELGFRMHGNIQIKPKFTGNELNVQFKGIITVELNGVKIYVQLCDMRNSGLMMGKFKLRLKGNFFFYYPDAKLKGYITVGANKDSKMTDNLSGGIAAHDTPVDMSSGCLQKSLFPKKKGETQLISTIQGNWLSAIRFDNKLYWEQSMECMRLLMYKDVLPSDWRYREDLLWKLHGNAKSSNAWKYKLEAIQRKFRKLRQAYRKSKKKH